MMYDVIAKNPDRQKLPEKNPYTGCPKINGQFETAGIQSVFKIFSKTQLSDHHKIWPFYKHLRFLKSVVK